MAKKYLIVLRDLTGNASERLDLALALAALEQTTSILFLGTGVYQLLVPEHLKILQALDLYDIKNVYIARTSLEDFNLDQKRILISAEIVDNNFINHLFINNDVIL